MLFVWTHTKKKNIYIHINEYKYLPTHPPTQLYTHLYTLHIYITYTYVYIHTYIHTYMYYVYINGATGAFSQ